MYTQSLDGEQRIYDELANQINGNIPISKEQEIRFYELHFRVPIKRPQSAYKIIEDYRIRKSTDDRVKLTNEERMWIFKILDEKRRLEGLNRWEYRQLSFIKSIYKLEGDFAIPKWPDLISISIADFRSNFVFNSARLDLFQTVLHGLILCANEFSLTELSIVVGGSFVTDKDTPNDVDIVLILPVVAFRRNSIEGKINSISSKFENHSNSGSPRKLLDINVLPSGYDSDLYMAYELLTLLGNISSDRSNGPFRNLKFHEASLFKVEISLQEIISTFDGMRLTRICKHEAGHYVVARDLGFKTDRIALTMSAIEGHVGISEIIIDIPGITSFDDLVNLLEKRVKVLFAGVISESFYSITEYGHDQAKREMESGGGMNDYAKIRELVHVIRNIRFPKSTDHDEIEKELVQIENGLLQQAGEIVARRLKLIFLISDSLAIKVVGYDTCYELTSEELQSIYYRPGTDD